MGELTETATPFGEKSWIESAVCIYGFNVLDYYAILCIYYKVVSVFLARPVENIQLLPLNLRIFLPFLELKT